MKRIAGLALVLWALPVDSDAEPAEGNARDGRAAGRPCGRADQWMARWCWPFEPCAAYAADQDTNNAAAGWAESTPRRARQAVLAECGSRGGSHFSHAT